VRPSPGIPCALSPSRAKPTVKLGRVSAARTMGLVSSFGSLTCKSALSFRTSEPSGASLRPTRHRWLPCWSRSASTRWIQKVIFPGFLEPSSAAAHLVPYSHSIVLHRPIVLILGYHGRQHLVIAGFATEVVVLHAVLDAIAAGYQAPMCRWMRAAASGASYSKPIEALEQRDGRATYTSPFQYSLTSYLRTSSTQVVSSPCRGMSRS